MTTMTVWLLAVMGSVYGGGHGTITPHMFPTLQACEQVAKNAKYEWRVEYRCIQTEVMVKK